MISRKLFRLFVLAALVLLTAHPLFAQDTPALTQTAQMDVYGYTLSISYPEGWVSLAEEQDIFVGNSAATLAEYQSTHNVSTEGAVGIEVFPPTFLSRVDVQSDAPPLDIVKSVMAVSQLKGTAEVSDDFSVPAATAVVTSTAHPEQEVQLGVLAFPDGKIVFGVLPASGVDATVMAILQSITFTPPEVSPPPTIPQDEIDSVRLTPNTFDVTQPEGLYSLSLGLPDGWVTQYSANNGLLYLANSDAALPKASVPDVKFAPGEVAGTVALPRALRGLGISPTSTPEETLSRFKQISGSEGQVQTVSGFDVPAAYAHLTGGNLPDGGGDVYALATDAGPIFIAIQPGGMIDAAVMAMLQSIRLSAAAPASLVPQATPTTAPEAKILRQWASYADGTSQFGTDDWSFEQATGKPNTTECGDEPTAWASDDSTGRAVLRLGFDHPVIPTQINVYETFNPGAIVEIDVGNSSNPDRVLPLPYSADPSGNTECPGVFSLDVSGVDTPIDFVVLYLNQSLTGNWNEIDAVELVGTPAE